MVFPVKGRTFICKEISGEQEEGERKSVHGGIAVAYGLVYLLILSSKVEERDYTEENCDDCDQL